MAKIREIVHLGNETPDIPVNARLGAILGLPVRAVKLDGMYWLINRLPDRLRANKLVRKFIQASSPWVDALVIARYASPSRLLLVKQHRSALAYLLTFARVPFRKSPFVITWFAIFPMPRGLTLKMYRAGVPGADAVFVYTPKDIQLYQDCFGLKPAQIKLVPLVVPQETFEAPEGPPPGEDVDVIMTGISGRDWDLFGRVCKAMPELKFVAIARNPLLDGVEDLPNLTKFDVVDYQKYCDLMRRSKVVLLLLLDQFGAVGQRDLLAIGGLGRPLVVTRTDAIRHYTDEEGAVRFVEGSDEGAIAAEIRDLLARPEERKAMGVALKRRIMGKCDVESVARSWAEHLTPLLS